MTKNMKIEIVSGQPNIKLENKFTEVINENGIIHNDDCVWMWPEREIYHPRTLYDLAKEKAKFNIEHNIDLAILTYSELVLYAMKIEIARHNFHGAKIHQFMDDRKDMCVGIFPCRCIDKLSDGIFDATDRALNEMLELKLSYYDKKFC